MMGKDNGSGVTEATASHLTGAVYKALVKCCGTPGRYPMHGVHQTPEFAEAATLSLIGRVYWDDSDSDIPEGVYFWGDAKPRSAERLSLSGNGNGKVTIKSNANTSYQISGQPGHQYPDSESLFEGEATGKKVRFAVNINELGKLLDLIKAVARQEEKEPLVLVEVPTEKTKDGLAMAPVLLSQVGSTKVKALVAPWTPD